MAQKIKFPTLITAPLASHHQRYDLMVTDVVNVIGNYNNRPADDKLRIPFRGKTKVKVIKHINTDRYSIGQRTCVQLCIEEFKEGNDDLYFKRGNNAEVQITPTDHLGSSRNYALLYPLKELHDGQVENKWLVIIYDTPNKDDSDIINTVKYTVNKILGFNFKFVIPELVRGQARIPKIEVTYATAENVDNEQLQLRAHILRSSAKTTKKIEYSDVPSDAVDTLLDTGDVDGRTKKRVKFIFDLRNKFAYKTVTQERQDNGNVTSEVVSKYSYDIDVDDAVRASMFDTDAMRLRFTEVITNYLTNGQNPADNG